MAEYLQLVFQGSKKHVADGRCVNELTIVSCESASHSLEFRQRKFGGFRESMLETLFSFKRAKRRSETDWQIKLKVQLFRARAFWVCLRTALADPKL